ncbi:hypothetical+protein [Methylocapsa aurea]
MPIFDAKAARSTSASAKASLKARGPKPPLNREPSGSLAEPCDISRYAPGDVVVVPFPSSDCFAEKRRPALVVSNDEVTSAGFLWLVMITTAQNSGMDHDVPIEDLSAAGLSRPSIVRPVKIANVEPSRIVRRAGRLGATQAEAVFEAVRSFIGREPTKPRKGAS